MRDLSLGPLLPFLLQHLNSIHLLIDASRTLSYKLSASVFCKAKLGWGLLCLSQRKTIKILNRVVKCSDLPLIINWVLGIQNSLRKITLFMSKEHNMKIVILYFDI